MGLWHLQEQMDQESIHVLRGKEEGLSSIRTQPSSTAHQFFHSLFLFQHLHQHTYLSRSYTSNIIICADLQQNGCQEPVSDQLISLLIRNFKTVQIRMSHSDRKIQESSAAINVD